MSTILLEIVTPDHIAYSGQVEGLVVRGVEGALGILPGHIPFVTPLQVAPIIVQLGKEQHLSIAISGGFVEVRKDKVVVLAESAELSEEIDVERARAAQERAERRLAARSTQDHIDFQRAELALKRAMNRIDVSGQNK
ncbi:F-type H+-transporting ATPase subunit epsilon [Paenibacillus sp. DS2015]|uniref:F0F1 ATP synthase subunit epsilon n=1 Tax=Paenibacillus sp. DS2015 TaxID=3373917 RepID=UPI003D248EEF